MVLGPPMAFSGASGSLGLQKVFHILDEISRESSEIHVPKPRHVFRACEPTRPQLYEGIELSFHDVEIALAGRGC